MRVLIDKEKMCWNLTSMKHIFCYEDIHAIMRTSLLVINYAIGY